MSKAQKKKAAVSPRGICRVCSCTENEPCNPPCSWADRRETVCSNCYDMAQSLSEWFRSALKPDVIALAREVDL